MPDEEVMIEALKIIRQKCIKEMDAGFEGSGPHRFSREFERKMNELLKEDKLILRR